jgi:hypothetical protein
MGTPPGGWGQTLGGSGGGGSFSGITGGTNTNSLIIGSGGSLTATGTGTITATNGSGGSAFPAAPVMGFYLSSACPTTNTGQCFNTPANTQQFTDCTWTSGSPTVNCNTAHFSCPGGIYPCSTVATGSDVGKRIFGYQTCAASVNLAANNNNQPITTSAALTILTVNSATQVTMSGNAANTATIITGTAPGGCLIFGNPDDAGAVAMDAAMQAATFCPKAHLAAANYLFTTPHFFTNPPACYRLGVSSGLAAAPGNVVYSAGFELEGRGSGTTIIYIPPGFPETGTCTNGFSGVGCWSVPLEGKWTNFQITGGGNRVAPNIPTGTNIIEVDGPASVTDFLATNFGGRGAGGTSANNGIGAYVWAQFNHINLSGFGTIAMNTGNTSSITAIQMWLENVGTGGIAVGRLSDYAAINPATQFSLYDFICYDCTIDIESTVDAATPPFLLVNHGKRIKWYRGGLSTVSFPVQTQNNIIGYYCETAGCILDIENAFLDLSQPSTGTGYIAIQCAAACTNYIKNSTIKGTSGGGAYVDGSASSILFDMGGNTFGAVTITGKVFNSYSITGTTLATTNVVLSGLGTGLTAPSSASGNSLNGQFTYTLGTGPGANGTATVTFPTAFLQAPTCSAQVVGGSSTTILPLTVSSITTTGMVITYVGTFVTGTVITRFSCAN